MHFPGVDRGADLVLCAGISVDNGGPESVTEYSNKDVTLINAKPFINNSLRSVQVQTWIRIGLPTPQFQRARRSHVSTDDIKLRHNRDDGIPLRCNLPPRAQCHSEPSCVFPV